MALTCSIACLRIDYTLFIVYNKYRKKGKEKQ